MAHTESENRLAPFTLAIAKRPSSRRPPWIWKRQARRLSLKHRGIRFVLCVRRQELVSLCQLALAKLIDFVAADDKTKTPPTI